MMLFLAATENVFLTNTSLAVYVIGGWVQHFKHGRTQEEVSVKLTMPHMKWI